MRIVRALGVVVGLALGSGSACARLPPRSVESAATWAYTVYAPDTGSRLLGVDASFNASLTDRLAIDAAAAPFVTALEMASGEAWQSIDGEGPIWRVPECASSCRVRYRIDLGALAASCGDQIECARRVGDATLSPAMTWLMHPEPNGDANVTLEVRTKDPRAFATGLGRDATGARYAFRSSDLDEGSFTAFGPMRRSRVELRGGTLDVVMLGGPLAMSDDAVVEWLSSAASIASSLYDRFPVEHATVFIVPVHADSVVFGKVLALAGASIVLLVGDRMTAADTQHDWVAVHELFHLGFPSFRGEGRWLGEGLATYYEPILRARAGWMSEKDLWQAFAIEMPRGLPVAGVAGGLEGRHDLDAMYWGGALFALEADVGVRRATENKKALDDVLRVAAERGGNATRVWSVVQVMRLGDDVTATSVLGRMYERQGLANDDRVDLEALLADLGVQRSGQGIELRDDRPLSSIRRAILRGK